ncbi:MAG TPA: L-2-hydroxyglutarate oxidase [Terriglobales bacterium]|jgi:L-2-hydroxyglutarate oxidase|nr:L-2-hydroxyglutarate oxidase [Terriglobales bacterium]
MPEGRYDFAVIGGGIVGLSTALHLTQAFPHLRVLLIEKEGGVARHQSGHNSGVIHSGIYYKPGSLKAKLCVEGASAMVAFCEEHGIPHKICGKLIVATQPEELPRIQVLLDRARANGLPGVQMLSADQIREYEPHCAGLGALRIPSSGITDYVAVCEKYAELIAQSGGSVRTGMKVTAIDRRTNTVILRTNQDDFETRFVINCAGLHSDRIGRLTGDQTSTSIVPFRGEYYDLVPEKQYLVKNLIYPAPDPRFPFLGVHFTRRIQGGVDAGPNAVLAFKREGYRWSDVSLVDVLEMISFPGFWRLAYKNWRYGVEELYRSLNKAAFVSSLQRLVPEIQSSDLIAAGSGVRAQAVQRDGSLVNDFCFVRSGNVLQVYNVPSPAATASLSIGREIVKIAKQEFGFTN